MYPRELELALRCRRAEGVIVSHGASLPADVSARRSSPFSLRLSTKSVPYRVSGAGTPSSWAAVAAAADSCKQCSLGQQKHSSSVFAAVESHCAFCIYVRSLSKIRLRYSLVVKQVVFVWPCHAIIIVSYE